jgi:DNA replicative helicase MCM subunit Mcm2 (Cdc46/Mcm family)
MKGVIMKVKPMLMQFAEPEFMCPECGNKFYVYTDDTPKECKGCGAEFIWTNKSNIQPN